MRSEALKYDNVWGENLHGFVLDPRTSTDLDEPEDFIRAEKLYKKLKRERRKN
jgi:CMP-N-acetylneuraminic acid synthetase